MADPVSGSTTSPDTSSTGSTGGGWLSDIGNFISSPTGQLATAAGTVGLGMYNASQASNQAKGYAGQLSAAGAPASSVYGGTIGQLTGGPTVGGPTGQIISGTTGAAGGLLQTAEQYASGALTPAQQQLIQQQTSGQEAALGSSLGNRIDSSARVQGMEAIGNNAAMLQQQLVQGNVALAQGALQSATTAYNSLVSNALQAGQLGLSATSQAVQTAMQADTQIAGYINQLISQVAQGLAGGGSASSTGTTPGGQLGSAIKNLFSGGGGSVASPTDAFGAQTTQTALQSPVASDYFSSMQQPDINIDTSSLNTQPADVASSFGSEGW